VAFEAHDNDDDGKFDGDDDGAAAADSAFASDEYPDMGVALDNDVDDSAFASDE
jgi:hypothetical protein